MKFTPCPPREIPPAPALLCPDCGHLCIIHKDRLRAACLNVACPAVYRWVRIAEAQHA